MDIVMSVLKSGKERTVEAYRKLLASVGFYVNRVVPVPREFQIIEAATNLWCHAPCTGE